MTGFSNSPQLIKSGIVLVDPKSLDIKRVINVQYNPHTVTRTLQVQGAGGGDQGSDRTEALRMKGPAVETIKVEVEIDATDQLEMGNPISAELGIQPQLAALQTIVNPSVTQVRQSEALEQRGFIDVFPMESLLTLFIWGRQRILPVRITQFSVTEEAFDNNLNPIRAKVALDMRVLSFDDLGFSHKGGKLYLDHMVQQEILAALSGSGSKEKMGAGDLL